MKSHLRQLMEMGVVSPLSYFFARFVAEEDRQPEDGLLALTAALVSENNLQGDVCVDLTDHAGLPLFSQGDLYGPVAPALDEWLHALESMPAIGAGQGRQLLHLEGHRLYLAKYLAWEKTVAEAIRERIDSNTHHENKALSEALLTLFPPVDDDQTDWQRVAAAMAMANRFTVITGGPGTGKTTTVVKILALLLQFEPGQRIALAAPTGKAAARLSESIQEGKQRLLEGGILGPEGLGLIPEEASTLHRLLGVREGVAFHDADNPLNADCLVVDEASMIDLGMMAKTFNALNADCRVILLGDRDQLASVSAGRVLGDITGHGREILYGPAQVDQLQALGVVGTGEMAVSPDSPMVANAVAQLRKSHRFQAASGIGRIANSVNKGQPGDALESVLSGGFEDLAWLENGGDKLNKACVDWAVEAYRPYLQTDDVGVALGLFSSARLLCALQKGVFGVQNINDRIEALLVEEGLIPEKDCYHGMPVMITRNDYDTGLFNGDMGLIWGRGDELRAWFSMDNGDLRSFSLNQLPEYTVAYTMTVHKSQGSEFNQVLLLLPTEESPVVTQELIYTGITRAKEKLVLAAERKSFIAHAGRQVRRVSGLADRLGWN